MDLECVIIAMMMSGIRGMLGLCHCWRWIFQCVKTDWLLRISANFIYCSTDVFSHNVINVSIIIVSNQCCQ